MILTVQDRPFISPQPVYFSQRKEELYWSNLAEYPYHTLVLGD